MTGGSWWPWAGTQLQQPKPAPFQRRSSTYLGASLCGQAEPRNVPLGKAQPALAWRQVPAASSSFSCQVSSSVHQGMWCLGIHRMPFGWQQPVEWGSMCSSPWASEGADFGWRWDPCVSYQDIGLLQGVSALGGSSSPPDHIPGECTLLQWVSWSTAG